MKVEVIQAWPGRYESATVELPEGASVADAVAAAGLPQAGVVAGHAIFGVLATPETVLRDGDRVELLRALRVDPKEARRRRAQKPKS